VFTEQLPSKGRIKFTKPLPSNDRSIHKDTQTDGRDL
jgi:hypothetical protein